MQVGLAEELTSLAPAVEDAVSHGDEHVPGVHPHDAPVELHLGQRTDDGPPDAQLPHAASGEEQRRLVAGVDVDQVAGRLQLTVEHGHEAARQAAPVDHAVQLGEHRRHLQLPLDPHAKPRHQVPDEQRRGQAVAAGVADGDAEHLTVEGYEVEEVAPHLLRRHRARGQLVTGELGQLVEEQALLDLGRFPEAAPRALFHQPGAEGGAHGVEGEIQLLADPALAHEQEDQVAVAAGADGQRRRRASRKDPGPGRRAFRPRVGEDVDAVLQDERHRRGARVEGVAGGVAQVADRLHEGEALAPFRVEDGGAQAEVLP